MWIQENSNLKKVTNWCNFYESKVKCSMNQNHLAIIYISQKYNVNSSTKQAKNFTLFNIYTTKFKQSNQHIIYIK